MSALETVPLGTVGAEVIGVDPDRLHDDAELPGHVMAALEQYGALVFRRLHIDDQTQSAFSKKLDDVAKAEPAPAPNIYIVSLDPAKSHTAEYTKGTFAWHIDGAQDDVPAKATTLRAVTLSASGGATEFASTYAAYDDLSAEERERYGDLRIVHSFESSQRLANPDPSPEQLARWHAKPDKEHPLVWAHCSGRRSLVIGATASHVLGRPRDEGKALLDDLLIRATAADRVYRHEWAVGDFVIWDNTGVLHRVTPYAPDSAREMHRTTMSGDEPIQ
jgi:alpha-ketoglutarate-dependent taurine dioxygenase